MELLFVDEFVNNIIYLFTAGPYKNNGDENFGIEKWIFIILVKNVKVETNFLKKSVEKVIIMQNGFIKQSCKSFFPLNTYFK